MSDRIGWSREDVKRAKKEGLPLTCIAVDPQHVPEEQLDKQALMIAVRGATNMRLYTLLRDLIENLTLRPEATFEIVGKALRELLGQPVEKR